MDIEKSGKKILVIEDEPSIRDLLKDTLSAHFDVALAKSAKEGLMMTSQFHPNLILLDLGLPDSTGLEVLKELRKWTQIPVIVITANENEEAKVSLLDHGADDYLTKPFGLAELMARVRVGLRNRGSLEATPVFESKDLKISLNERSVEKSGKIVHLTATEFEVLRLLARSPGQIVSQNTILKGVWGAASQDQVHYLRVYIGHLRKKLENDPSLPEHILTEPNVGYRLV